ncbi:MAG: AAA family ATPase [Bacillota bacterium]|nr:AAA family ATPase [Bacillota bacterium]
MDYYDGARFYKCDLHMHTPMDRNNWRDEATKLKYDDSEARKREVARLYLKQCHAVGLEVIAITDHNFAPSPEHSFLKWLREENEAVAAELDKPTLYIFGGFEVEADVGTGHHVLCILPVDMALHIMDGRALSCGLKHEERFDAQGRPKQSTKRLTDIIDAIQKEKNNQGIVICAHPFNKNGLLCDNNAEMWLQQEEFQNPDLLCMEIPKPIETMSQGLQKLIIGGEKCLPEWKRRRPIAYIMSSDSYRLTMDQAQPSNYIGYRYTWIKMSRPSIESLRQAFLDRESRIRFGERSPEENYNYPMITRVMVNGATFYQAEPFLFGSNLNCLIGSRGTGKSTLLDYIRIALDRLRTNDAPQRVREELEKKINDTLPQHGQVTIDVQKDGVPYRIEFSQGEQPYKITNLNTNESNPLWDVRSLFYAKILSQREIDQSIDSQDSTPLRRLLDDFIRSELNAKNEEANEIIGNIEKLEIEIGTLKEKQSNRSALETNKARLEATLQLLDALQEPLQRWQGISYEQEWFSNISAECQELVNGLKDNLAELKLDSMEIPEETLENLPNKELVQRASKISNGAFKLLIGSIHNAIEAFERRTILRTAPLRKLFEDEWLPIYEQEKGGFDVIKKDLEAKGDKPEEYLQYKKELDETKVKLGLLNDELEQIDNLEAERRQLLEELQQCWRQETEIRKQKADELMEHLKLGNLDKALVQISVEHQGNQKSLVENMVKYLRDRRRLNEVDINNVVTAIVSRPAQPQENEQPIEKSFVQKVIEECNGKTFLHPGHCGKRLRFSASPSSYVDPFRLNCCQREQEDHT